MIRPSLTVGPRKIPSQLGWHLQLADGDGNRSVHLTPVVRIALVRQVTNASNMRRLSRMIVLGPGDGLGLRPQGRKRRIRVRGLDRVSAIVFVDKQTVVHFTFLCRVIAQLLKLRNGLGT